MSISRRTLLAATEPNVSRNVLRRHDLFHDGSPFTAAELVFTMSCHANFPNRP